MPKSKIEINSQYSKNPIFEYKCDNNTLVKTLEEAIKQKINLHRLYLPSKSILCGVKLNNARLTNSRLVGCDLSDADFSHSLLRFSNFTKCNLTGANFQGAHLYRCKFLRADLSHSNLTGALLRGSDLADAKFNQTLLRDSLMDNIDLTELQFQGADLTDVKYSNSGSFLWDTYHFETKMSFGRYEHKTLIEILDNDPTYIIWCKSIFDIELSSEAIAYFKTKVWYFRDKEFTIANVYEYYRERENL